LDLLPFPICPDFRIAETSIFTDHPGATEQSDLRSSSTPWASAPSAKARPLTGHLRCDVLVVGAGITGALVAERLTREGRDVVLIDREDPGQGSTIASTAMLLWEIDRPLSALVDLYGFERAARAYRASFDAVNGLLSLAAQAAFPCAMRSRNSLYLASGDTLKPLQQEHSLRERADLPGALLDHAALMSRFGITRAGALLSPVAADADPVQLTYGLLRVAQQRGAQVLRAHAIKFETGGKSVHVSLDNASDIEARFVVLATGYVMPDIVGPTPHQAASSWAIATKPQPRNLWPTEALIWEASENYYYARTTRGGRIIFGGEDDEAVVEPEARDAATPAKAARLCEKLRALWPRAVGDIDFRWSGTFDTTKDGLPLIGTVPGTRNILAAYGYGGNGITFSYLAAALIAKLIAGQTSPLLDDFAIDRDID